MLSCIYYIFVYIEKHGYKNIYAVTHIHTLPHRHTQTYIFPRFAIFYVSWIDANILTGMMRCSLSCMSRQSRICMATMLKHSHIHLGSLYCAFVDYSKAFCVSEEISEKPKKRCVCLQIKPRYADAGSSAGFHRSERSANVLRYTTGKQYTRNKCC